MTLSKDKLHVYLRDIDARERTSLSVIVGIIGHGSRVLDVGCGSGALGQYLHEHKQCRVDGVTFNSAEAELARAHYGRIEVADLERTALEKLFSGQQYDFIVCADILEHLREPQNLLHSLSALLDADGRLLISIPNTGYAGLIAELAEGEFLYRKEGLLDATHVRHVTRRSLVRLLQESGWQVQALETIERQLHESEFKVWFDALPPAAARYLLGRPDALTYQFIVTASCAPAGTAADNSAWQQATEGVLPAQACFTAQLFWDDGTGFSEDRKCVRAAAVGQDHQLLEFVLPENVPGLRALKFDPADRPGFVHLYALELQDGAGRTLWRWDVVQQGFSALLQGTQSHALSDGARLLGSSETLALATGDDPWLVLPLDAGQLSEWAGQGALRLCVEMGWPMSADFATIASQVGPLVDEKAFLRRQTDGQQAQIAQAAREHERLALELGELHHAHAGLQHAHAGLQRQTSLEIRRNAAEITDLQRQLRGMDEHLRNIRNSRLFRYSRPLVKLRDMVVGRPGAGGPAQADGLLPVAADQGMEVPPPGSETVDVIVPVYKGLEDTRLCIESVLASPVRTPYRLIVINDCSPQPELTAWLRDKAQQEGDRITLLENRENLGFVGTVNRGMRESDANDVLLLNSDTEVANDWLDRIRKAAYSSARAGTVTPFSSNATICSYPQFCKDNPLPEGCTTARLDALFARANAGKVVDVPTGVGFCMYIRRDCLRETGLFDEKHFGKGYGEENDFCQRAQGRGWRNLHALDTYVLHTGGVSFGESKSPREQAAMETLRQLHPRYESEVLAFVRRDPARAARLAVDWLRLSDEGKLPVILCVHHQRGGGTERHVLELARLLAGRALLVSFKPISPAGVHIQLVVPGTETGSGTEAQPGDDGGRHVFSGEWSIALDGTKQRELILELLGDMGVAHIHYHHMLGHEAWVWDLPQLLGVSYDFTAHDFYSFCTNITLTGRDGRYQIDAQGECCGGVHPAPVGQVEPDIAAWRRRNKAFLENARHVLAPSLDTVRRMHGFVPEAALRYAPHSDLDPKLLAEPHPYQRLADGQPLRIAVIGALSVIKGADMLERVAQLAKKRNLPLEFHLIGFAYRHLQTAPASALRVYGQFDDKDLPAMLQRLQPDLVWLPARWPETYSYTLSAALQQAIPVAVPDLGAFPERVAGRAWSWVLPWDLTPEQWLERFLAIREEHFMTGVPAQPPAEPAGLEEARERWGDWDYARDYLPAAGLAPEQVDAAAPALANVIERATRNRLVTGGVAGGLKGGLLNGLVRMRSTPLMRPIARAVPPQVQSRLKSWLQR